MKSSIHVGVCHAAKEFGVVFTQGVGIGGRIFVHCGSICLENMIIRPELLVLLFDRDKSIALFGLESWV